MLTTENFQKSKDSQIRFLRQWLDKDSGLEFRFMNEGTATLNKQAFDSKARENHYSGMDVLIFERSNEENCIRLRCFLPEAADGRYQVNYNIPNDILSKESALHFLSSNNIFFLTIRRKGLSITFWLDRYDDYPPEDYNLVARFKSGRKDRLVLKTRDINLRKFHYIEELVPMLKHLLANRY